MFYLRVAILGDRSSLSLYTFNGLREERECGSSKPGSKCNASNNNYRDLHIYIYLEQRVRYQNSIYFPFRTAVPSRGQTTWNLSSLSPNRGCSTKRVELVANRYNIPGIRYFTASWWYYHRRGAPASSWTASINSITHNSSVLWNVYNLLYYYY